MATNLINQLTNEFRGDTLKSVATAIGESTTTTQSALGGVIPALVGGLARKASTPSDANGLLDLIRRNKLDSGPFADVSSATKAPDGINNLINTGRSMLDSVFGGRTNSVADWVSSLGGMTRSSSSTLLSLAMPLVLGQIGRRVSEAGGGASSLMNLLADQRTFLKDAPPGLAGVLGGPDVEPAASRHVGTYDAEPRHQPPVVRTFEPAPRSRSSWLWVLPLLALIPLLAYFLTRREEPRREVAVERPATPRAEAPAPAPRAEAPAPAPRAEPPAAAPVGTASKPALPAASLGSLVERQLPNDTTLRIPENGVESKLLAYIQEPGRAVGKETWFSFDRIEFEMDSATLKPSSQEQLRNVADIMKAYPDVAVKIGGYTDNTGDAATNMQLSDERATAAMNAIADAGIDRSRIEAEGYGENHPVADNDTAEGRQRNRRVDIRVTKK